MTAEEWPAPRFDRVAAAFIAAPLFASLLTGAGLATFTGGAMGPWLPMAFGIAVVALMVAAPLTVVLGIPAYLLLRRRVKARLTGSALTGAAIAATPWLAVVLAGAASGSLAEPWTILWPLGLLIVVGAASGALFWWIAFAPRGRRGPAAR